MDTIVLRTHHYSLNIDDLFAIYEQSHSSLNPINLIIQIIFKHTGYVLTSVREIDGFVLLVWSNIFINLK